MTVCAKGYTTARIFVLVKFTLKTQVIQSVHLYLPTPIPKRQPPLVIENALNCSETNLPVYQSIQLINQCKITYIIAYQRSSALKCIVAESINIGRLEDVLKDLIAT